MTKVNISANTNWKPGSDNASIVHTSGFVVSFTKTPLPPGICAVSGIEALNNTPWAGKVDQLVEEALRVWRGL